MIKFDPRRNWFSILYDLYVINFFSLRTNWQPKMIFYLMNRWQIYLIKNNNFSRERFISFALKLFRTILSSSFVCPTKLNWSEKQKKQKKKSKEELKRDEAKEPLIDVMKLIMNSLKPFCFLLSSSTFGCYARQTTFSRVDSTKMDLWVYLLLPFA